MVDSSVEGRLAYLASLKPGWLDGYGAAIDPRSIERARQFIRMTGVTGFGIFPTEEGFVSLEWSRYDEGWFLQMEFDGDEEDRGDSAWVLNLNR